MRVRTSDDQFSDFGRDQYESELMKAWMLDNGWSVSFSRDPEEIFMLVEEFGEDADFNLINS